MSGEGRPAAYRIALTLWNLLTPGIGLVRAAGPRSALPWLLAPYALTGMVVLASATLPVPGFRPFLAIAVLLGAAGLVTLLAPMVRTWRESAIRPTHLPVSQRWPALLGVFVAASVAAQAIQPAIHHFYKPFFVPGESMIPTLLVGDRLLADMRGGRHPRRGEIVLARCDGQVRIYRVAGLPGDRIAVERDRPAINGVAAVQQDTGRTIAAGRLGPARLVMERLPGEERSHRLAIDGDGAFATTPAVTVPPGDLFLLGDDRDLSADSRVPPEMLGCGPVPLDAVIGRPLFVTLSRDRARIGTDLTGG